MAKNINFNNSKEEKKKPIWLIDMDMLTSKFALFSVNAKDSCYWPYMVPFLKSVGLTTTQAGMVSGLRLAGCIVGSPIWSIIADHNNKHSFVMLILCIFSTLFFCSQPFVAAITNQNSVYNISANANKNNNNFQYSNGTLSQANSDLVKNSKFNNISMSKSYTMKATEKPNGHTYLGDRHNVVFDDHHGKSTNMRNSLFRILLITNVIASFFDSSLLSFTDAIVLERVKASSRGATYGIQRLFGSMGFAIGTFASSLAIDKLPLFGNSRYDVIFAMYAFYVIGLAIVIRLLYKDMKIFTQSSEDSFKTKKLVWETLTKLKNICFFLTVFVVVVMQGFHSSFIAVYVEEMDGHAMLVGLTIVIGSVASIPYYIASQRIINYIGTWNTFIVAILTWCAKYLAYYLIKTPWHILIVEMFLHGSGYGLFIAAIMAHVRDISPPKVLTTTCSVTNTLFFYVSSLIANVFGGVLYEVYGIHNIFLGIIFMGLFWCFLLLIFLYFIKQETPALKQHEIEMCIVKFETNE